MPRAPRPLLVIGLDGASHTVLSQLRLRLPHLHTLIEEGAAGIARSTQPPATFPAWTSVLTGCPPEVHGVRDLMTRNHADANLRPASGTERRVPLIVEELARDGYRVACLGVPGLFPPPEAPGLYVSGFDAPGADRAVRSSVFPPSLYRELEWAGGWRYAIFNEQRVDVEAAVDALLADIDAKSRTILRLQRRCRWDLFFVHLQASDTACHHLWPGWDRDSPRARAYPASDALPRVFERLDQLVGQLRAEHDGLTLLVSDHGFGGASDVAVHLNRALAEAGLLRFQERSRWRDTVGHGLRATVEQMPSRMLSLAMRLSPRAVLDWGLTASRQADVARSHSAVYSDELDYAPSLWLRRALTVAERDRMENVLASLHDPDSGQDLIERLHWRTGDGFGPDIYLEPAWPGGYRPCFIPSHGPGPSVRRLVGAELRAGRGAGMPGVHHPDGVVAVSPSQPLDLDCTLPEIGASIPSLMGVRTKRRPERSPPALAVALGLLEGGEPLSRAGLSEAVSPIAKLPRPSAAVTARLKALGYL